ncbi:MAG: hypothetical protein ACJA2W_003521, partial [Planctomycetota bacterium]
MMIAAPAGPDARVAGPRAADVTLDGDERALEP